MSSARMPSHCSGILRCPSMPLESLMPGVTMPGRISIWWYQCGTASMRARISRSVNDEPVEDKAGQDTGGLRPAGAGAAATVDAVNVPSQRPFAVSVRDVSKAFRLPRDQMHTLKERALHPLRRSSYDRLEALHD